MLGPRGQAGSLHLSSSSLRRKWKWKGKGSALAFVLLLVSAAWLLVVFSRNCCPAHPDPDDMYGWYRVPHLNPNFSDWQRHGPNRPTLLPLTAGSNANLSLHNIVFCVAASAKLWPMRKEIVKLWWREGQMRGFVWLEEPARHDPAEHLPMVMVSEDVARLRYGRAMTHHTGVRISRIVLETFRLNMPDVHWFVLADDDTIFSTDNLVRVLSKYDPSQFHYIGGSSESHQQNLAFSYGMAFGGGGVAISYALAAALVGMQDECLEHYPELHGSDDRLHACICELGVPLTRELGFHQCDIRGNPLGLLGSHPIAPFVSLHHVDVMDPVFPGLAAHKGLQLLSKAMQMEPGSFLQQSFCYNQKQGFSFSVSIGYVVQVFPEILYPQNLQRAQVTFQAWNRKAGRREFDLDTRLSKSICWQPYLFYLDGIEAKKGDSAVITNYSRYGDIDERKKFWWCHYFPREKVITIRVTSQRLPWSWYQVPRRQCCSVTGLKDKVLDMKVGPCQPGEVIVP
ncbi:hypothetical protein O6H91_02G028200 [Diphasiastrum complanatum]|uniref:Uncharacterized protein n=7 Tax=Diphasiastrum complanatum TaxID=34168 RepID=A0ACC2EDJ4_DIPCM|nr:hypothetical protein O6H91_02G028200 [Diphasiastrum complanatum]KAJ7564659.1 hypothetical protein O6H91_02G028200 [Diphasiastrum complanatum]KAJ7564660.1 hypothetical protein O6H91_02G028200 [Diphasiastrum complanatum]KAJ7564661.1 hypothetical protein O6H91_02G028200 [Diphasiastrum complanatum]KAJ7564662.1 hypothetical protein O6H91_02G028200 [Diphasiastrum complanatum]